MVDEQSKPPYDKKIVPEELGWASGTGGYKSTASALSLTNTTSYRASGLYRKNPATQCGG